MMEVTQMVSAHTVALVETHFFAGAVVKWEEKQLHEVVMLVEIAPLVPWAMNYLIHQYHCCHPFSSRST